MYKLHRHEIRLEGGQAMNKEQEEAIERLSSFKTIEILYSNTFAMHIEQLKTLQGDIETVLSMLQEQQKENKKKDKIIEKMAEKLNQAYFDEDKFCIWFEKMMGVQQKMDYGYVVDLIKQYFENKVKE